MEPKDGSELLHSHDQTWTDKELLLLGEQREWFPEMESPAGEVAVRTVEMTTKDAEHYVDLVGNAVAGLERMNSSSESSSVGKMLWNSIACDREIVRERKSQSIQKTSLSYFKKLPHLPPPSVMTALTGQQPSAWRQNPPAAKRLYLAEGWWCLALFSHKVLFNCHEHWFLGRNGSAHFTDYCTGRI